MNIINRDIFSFMTLEQLVEVLHPVDDTGKKLTVKTKLDKKLVLELFENYSKWKSKVYLDLSFQSPFRWKFINEQNFLVSILNGYATSPIVMADVEKCYSNAKDDNTKKYFGDLMKRGYLYVIVDGNNRNGTIIKFYLNLIPLPNDTYYNIDHPSQKWTVNGKGGGVYFEDLPVGMQTYLDQVFLNITMVEGISRKSLSSYFDALNTGVTLNSQEKRNSWYSKLAELIRNASDKYRNEFKVISNLNLQRRQHDEFIAVLSVISLEEQFLTGVKQKEMNRAYGNNKDYSTDAADLFNSTTLPLLDDTMKAIKEFPKNIITKSSLLDIYNFMRQHQHLNVVDWTKLSERLVKCIIECKSSKKVVSIDNTGELTYNGLLRHLTVPQYQSARMGLLTESFYKKDDSNSFFSKDVEDTKDPQRIFTFTHRFQIWEKQGGKTPDGKTKIPLNELNDTSKWAADHYPVEWSLSGPTTVENGQIISVSDHMKRTAVFNRERKRTEILDRKRNLTQLAA